MARVVKTPQISEFLLSPLIKPSHSNLELGYFQLI